MMTTVREGAMIKVEELATKWDQSIERLIKQYGFRESNTIDDIKQELYVAWISGNYEAIYDPTKSAPSTFIHHFVVSRLKGYRSRKKRDVLHRAIPLVTDLDSGRGILVDLVEGTPEQVEELTVKVDEDGLLIELKGLSSRGYAGHVKDYIQIYNWLKEGKSQTEIAQLTEYSLGTVNAMVSKVRQMMESFTWKEELPS